MSTEICINYSDEISRYVSWSLDDDNKSYSNLDVNEKALLKEALSGNVRKEYEFAVAGKSYGRGELKTSLGDIRTLKKEALLDHAAKAQEPDALVHNAFINYFGGMATVGNKKKALVYAVQACLQGNYNAVGLLQHGLPDDYYPIFAVYKLEFLINSRASSLYETFYRAFYGKESEHVELSAKQYETFCQFASTNTDDEVRLRLFWKTNRRLILNMAESFSLGCILKIKKNESPDEDDARELHHFIKCLSLLEEIRRILERYNSAKRLCGSLNMLCMEVKASDSGNSSSWVDFDRALEIVIIRLYLEYYSVLASQKDSDALKALADELIPELEEKGISPAYRESPYFLRMASLYEIYFRNSETHQKLNEAFDKCTVPEFCRIARALDIEKLVVASLCNCFMKYKGEQICKWNAGTRLMRYSREVLASYISDVYGKLASNLIKICECANMHSQFSVIYKNCHEVCADFIRRYMALDPVLAYNDCEYSRKLSEFIKYAVDELSLPPKCLANIKKPAPYYGYTQTSAAGLYLMHNSEGKHWEEVSALNKPEQELEMLKQQIAEQDLNKIVMCFSLLKDNPSENYDYLLSEFLHKLSCSYELQIERQGNARNLFSNSRKLLEILITRAEYQNPQKRGIAAERLHDLSLSPHFCSFFENLSEKADGKAAFDELQKRFSVFKKRIVHKYPIILFEDMFIGDHDSGLYAMNNGNGCFADIRKVLSGGKLSDKDKDILKQMLTKYYRLLLLYNLRNPLRANNVLFTKIEEGYIGLIKNCIYPKAQVFRVEDSNSDNGFLKIPKMQVRDSDDKKNSDRSTEEMKKFEFEKKSDNETIDDEVETSEQHYELKNADKPLHIIGNRKLSEILNNKVIKALKTDPERMKKYGMNIVPNFILYGEPGCGKTEAVRQYCEHLGLEPVIINSATVGTSHIHETPVNIHNKFDEAISKKNGVIIIDEADAFLSERDNLRTDDDFKTEEVSASLQGIDLANRNHTQVIAMTNNPEKIDKAILRDGRLGLHIEITKPDETDLEEIIETFFEKSELEKLDKTQMVKALNGQTIASVYSILNGIRVDMVLNNADLSHQYVMHKINTSLGYTLEEGAYFSLPGQQEFEDYVNSKIVDHLLNPDWYRRYNLKFPNSILLYGPTGTGKTYAAKELANFLGWNFIKLDSKSIGSEAVQGSAIKIAKVFDRARREAPCIIFIDEIDAWIPKRSGRSTSSEIGQVNEFLANMSQVNSDNLLLIGTTNRIDDIDEAALRNGRFSTKIEIGYMKGEQVEELLNSLIKDIPYDDSIDLSEIAKTQDNKSVADIVAFFEKACRFSAENKYDFLTKECFQKAMDTETKKDECRRIGFL